MIKIVQAGHAGDSKYLVDMHRFRTRIFSERMGWDVHVDQNGLETDQFDCPEAVYFLSLNDQDQVIGTWRLVPTTLPIMINEVWPQFLDTIKIPVSPHIWEASRFAVSSPNGNTKEGLTEVNKATQELFIALTEACILSGIQEIYTLYDRRIARLIRRLGCTPFKTSEELPVDQEMSCVGAFKTDDHMLNALRSRCRDDIPALTLADLPPSLRFLRGDSGLTQDTQKTITAASA